mmetsp:Transcript_18146/g.46440  ORF Transcript_18146/g.46440 Transcript_18146/m.46440 type:complete len:94 (-) Transcript_18146:475-756(-)
MMCWSVAKSQSSRRWKSSDSSRSTRELDLAFCVTSNRDFSWKAPWSPPQPRMQFAHCTLAENDQQSQDGDYHECAADERHLARQRSKAQGLRF